MKPTNVLRILLVVAALSGYSAWSLAQRSEKPTKHSGEEIDAGIPLIGRDEAKALWDDSATLFVDVRPWTDYAYGHIEGAENLPWEQFKERFSTLKPRLEQAGTVVVYCRSVDCGASYNTAIRLRQNGLARIKIYPDGWNDWSEHGLPRSQPPER